MKTIQIKNLIPIISDGTPLRIILNRIETKERYSLDKSMIMARLNFYGEFYVKCIGFYVIDGYNTLWIEISTELFKE